MAWDVLSDGGGSEKWENPAPGAAVTPTLPRGSPVQWDLGGFIGVAYVGVPGAGGLLVHEESGSHHLSHKPQGSWMPHPSHSPSCLSHQTGCLFPEAWPAAGKQAQDQRLCNGETTRGWNGGLNCASAVQL